MALSRQSAQPTPTLPAPYLQAARDDLGAMMAVTTQSEYGYTLTPFHQLLCNIAMNVVHGKPGWELVILSTPPQHGKSETMSSGAPTYALGSYPHENVILATYGKKFADEWGRKVRDRLEEWGQEIFGIEVDKATRAVGEFRVLVPRGNGGTIGRPRRRLSNQSPFRRGGGKMYCSGLRGGITGKGAPLIFIDDPVKNSQEASSPILQATIYNLYKSAVRTRLRRRKNGRPGSICLTMTRWDEEDLAGKVIRAAIESGKKPMIINLPALAIEHEDWRKWGVNHTRAPGDALCPLLYNEAELAEIRAAVGEYYWQGMYQGNPQGTKSGMFQRHWYKTWKDPLGELVARVGPDSKPVLIGSTHDLPAWMGEFDLICSHWDFGSVDPKKAKDPDGVSFTVGQIWGLRTIDVVGADGSVGRVGEFWLLDQIRRQAGFTEQIAMVRELLDAWPECSYSGIEYKACGPAIMSALEGQFALEDVLPYGSKEQRAMAGSPLDKAGLVVIPAPGVSTRVGGSNWVYGSGGVGIEGAKGWLEEHLSFPGRFADQVDVSSQAKQDLREKFGLGRTPGVSGNRKLRSAMSDLEQRIAGRKVKYYER